MSMTNEERRARVAQIECDELRNEQATEAGRKRAAEQRALAQKELGRSFPRATRHANFEWGGRYHGGDEAA
jgi:hypothetical protein